MELFYLVNLGHQVSFYCVFFASDHFLKAYAAPELPTPHHTNKVDVWSFAMM
jgi:hypothetical protein